jgi:hypothetical protein
MLSFSIFLRNGKSWHMTALRLLILLIASIFCGEVAIMFALEYVAFDNNLARNALDATALVTIIFPFLYFFVFRAIVQKNKDLAAAQRQLLPTRSSSIRSNSWIRLSATCLRVWPCTIRQGDSSFVTIATGKSTIYRRT